MPMSAVEKRWRQYHRRRYRLNRHSASLVRVIYLVSSAAHQPTPTTAVLLGVEQSLHNLSFHRLFRINAHEKVIDLSIDLNGRLSIISGISRLSKRRPDCRTGRVQNSGKENWR